MRNDLGADLEERDYARTSFTAAELKTIFKGEDVRDFINPKSPAFKARGLAGRKLTEREAIELIIENPNLLKRPILITGGKFIAGFDKEAFKTALRK